MDLGSFGDGFFTAFASAGAFHSGCAETMAAPATNRVAATATTHFAPVLMSPPPRWWWYSHTKSTPFTHVRRGGSRTYSPAERFQHVLDRAELHAWTAARTAAFHLQPIERLPVGVRHTTGLTLPNQPLDRGAVGRRGMERRSGLGVVEHEGDGLAGVRLVRADDPARTALDPARGVLTGARTLRLRVQHPALLVEDHARPLVEGHAGKCDALVADRAKHEAGRDLLVLARRLRLRAPIAGLETVLHETKRPDVSLGVAEHFHRRDEKPHEEAPALPGRGAARVLLEDLHLLRGGAVG